MSTELANVFTVTDATFARAVVAQSEKVPVLVDFWAPWCGPCRMLMPVLEKLAADYRGKFLLATVNIDEQQGLAQQMSVRSVPTVHLFRHGVSVEEFMGVQPEAQIRALLDRHIERPVDKLLETAQAAQAQGQPERAVELLQQAVASVPDDYRLQIKLAALLIEIGHVDEAAALVQTWPIDVQTEAEVSALMGRLEFARAAAQAADSHALSNVVAQEPDNLQARYDLAARHVVQGQYEPALTQLLEILHRDRQFADGAARKGMIKIFELVGGGGPLVTEYRQKMSRALY